MGRPMMLARPTHARGFALGTAAVAATLLNWNIATAQAAKPATAESPRAEQGALEEVIVTARKRSESLQTVPIAITAFTADQIAEQRLLDTRDLVQTTPGLFSGGGQDVAILIIRGISVRPPLIGGDPGVGQYIDEVYQPRFSNTLTGLFDLLQIEVLKGPQGTLFGRNTTSGAVNYITRKPSQEPEASFTVGAGNLHLFEGRGYVSGPLTETLFGSLAVSGRTDDGYIKAVDAAGREVGNNGNDDYGARGVLRWMPTEEVTVDLSATTYRTKSARIISCDRNPCGAVAPLFANFFLSTPSAFAGNWRESEAGQTDGGDMIRQNDQYTARIDWEIGDNLTLTSLTAYQQYSNDLDSDLDYEVQPLAVLYTNEEADTFSQELRLAGQHGAFGWHVGGNYYVDDDSAFVNYDVIGVRFPSFNVSDLSFGKVKTTSWAAFLSLDYAITDALSASAGVRYSNDERDYRQVFQPNNPAYGQAFDSATISSWDTNPSWDDTTYDMSLRYQFSEDVMLYVRNSTGYRAGGLQGIGQVQNALQASQNYGPEDLHQVEVGLKSMFADRRIELNVAAYYTKVTDFQVSASSSSFFFGPIIQNAGEVQVKGGELSLAALLTDGFQVELGYAYTRSRFAEYNYTDDIAGAIAATNCTNPAAYGCQAGDYRFSGNPLEFTPLHSVALGLSYSHELGSAGRLKLRAEGNWKDKFLLAPLPQSVYSRSDEYLENNFLQQPAYALVNVNAAYEFPDAHWTVTLWAKNLLDKRYLVYGDNARNSVNGNGHNLILGEPRTYGLSIQWRH